MDAIQTTQYARALLNAHGDKAMVEAAQKMQACKAAGKTDEAEHWRKIRMAIAEMRGPNQS